MSTLNRRSMLRMVGASAVAAAVGSTVSCGGSGGSTSVTNAGTDLVPWPTYLPFAGPAPDKPGGENGVQQLYLKYPAKVVPSVHDKVGDGSQVTAMLVTYAAPPKPVENNQFWQAVNKALGVDLKVVVIPESEFQNKMTTVMASGDLPDIMMLGIGSELAREWEFIASQCADLSEFVGGDAVKAYPNLANIPTYAWRGMGRIGGRIYGIPLVRPLPGQSLLVNRNALDSVGAPRQWDREQFHQAMAALTGNRRWGIGGSKSAFTNIAAVSYYAGSEGAPHRWQVVDGKFVTTFGTPQYRQAIETMRRLAAAGCFYPDSLTVSQTDAKNFFYNGTVSAISDGFSALSQQALQVVNRRFELDFAMPYGREATPWQQRGGKFANVVFKKASPDRIRLLLRICNFFAAPFGSTEYELVNYGVEGVHYTKDSGDIALTQLAQVENNTNLPVKFIGAPQPVLYFPGFPEVAQRVYDWEQAVLPRSVEDPSAGLRSQTWSSKAAQLDKIMADTTADVVFGRKPMSAWDEAVKLWRGSGGDQAAEEFAKEYAANR